MGQPPGLEQFLNQLNSRLTVLEQQALRTRRQATAAEADRLLAHQGIKPRLPMDFKSQYGEDVFLYELFGLRTTGCFIEVGAHDGLQLSVSYAFEAMGWNGVLIEALPDQADACRRSRPHSRTVHAALVAPGSPPTATFTYTLGDPLLSFHVADTFHQDLVRREGGQPVSLTVPAMTMDAVLEGHTTPIDFASIDVEGGEVNLLRGFNLERYKPAVLLIEDALPPQQSQVLAYMSGQSAYQYAFQLPYNRVFIRRDRTDLFARLKLIVSGRL